MYKIGIVFTGEKYNRYVNAIKLEEARKNIEVIGIADDNAFFDSIDGWHYGSVEWILGISWDYLLVAGNANFVEIKKMLIQIGVPKEKILSIDIFAIPCFDFAEYIKLYESKLSIIAINCWGGLTYSSLKMEFMSPFVNLYMNSDDFLKMLENLEDYMNSELIYVGDGESIDVKYPVGRIDDVLIHFLHYKTFEEAQEKWNKRKQRINWDNLFVMMYTSEMEEAERFDRLPYEKKICFVPFETDIPSACNISRFNSRIDGAPNRLVENIIRLANNQLPFYNPVKLLNGDPNYKRC